MTPEEIQQAQSIKVALVALLENRPDDAGDVMRASSIMDASPTAIRIVTELRPEPITVDIIPQGIQIYFAASDTVLRLKPPQSGVGEVTLTAPDIVTAAFTIASILNTYIVNTK